MDLTADPAMMRGMETAAPPPALPRLPISWGIGYAVLLVGALAWCAAAAAEGFFLADDYNYLHHVRGAEGFLQYCGVGIGWIFFRPLTALSFQLDLAIWGLDPWGYHCSNLLLHAGTSLLVALVCRRWTRNLFGSALAGLAFALSPVHAEAVSWISGRGELVFGFGSLLCLWGFLGYAQDRRRGQLWLLGIGQALALGGKDSAMVLPALLSALALTAVPHTNSRPTTALMLSWGVLCAYLPIRFLALDGFGGAPPATVSPLQNAPLLLGEASLELLAPGNSGNLPWLCLGLLCYALLRTQQPLRLLRPLLPLALAYLVSLAPAATAFRLQPDGEHNRILYLPAVFFALALGQVFGRPRPQGDGRGLAMVATALLTVYAFGLRAANRPWAEAGAISRSLVTQLQELRQGKPCQWLAIYRFPIRYRGAQVFRNGLDRAVQIFVDPPLDVGVQGEGLIRDASQWERWAGLRRRDPRAYPDWLLVRWDPTTRRLVAP